MKTRIFVPLYDHGGDFIEARLNLTTKSFKSNKHNHFMRLDKVAISESESSIHSNYSVYPKQMTPN